MALVEKLQIKDRRIPAKRKAGKWLSKVVLLPPTCCIVFLSKQITNKQTQIPLFPKLTQQQEE